MYKVSEFKKPIYRAGETAEILGVTLTTLHYYDKQGKLKFHRSDGGHRLIKREDLLDFLDRKGMLVDDTNASKRDVVYTRVTSQSQSADLDHQAMQVISQVTNLQNPLILKEVGNGLDDGREKFKELIKMVLDGDVNNVYITHPDRLAISGYHTLETVFLSKGVNIIATDSSSGETNLLNKIIEIIGNTGDIKEML